MKKLLIAALGCALLLPVATLRAGGFLEQIDITGLVPSPIAGHVVGRLVPIRWDARTIPVQYQMNTTLDPIPNALGPAFLTVAAARAELQASLDAWNTIPTSYIDMRISGTTANPGVRGFDFRNELTFRTAAAFAAIASSPSVSLIEDADLVNGDDIDGDGDSDVSNTITVAADADGDGDIEFPPGFYRAGTILDNDVQFNTKTTNGFRFTIDPAAADTVTRSVDLMAVAVHEFGHSFGLSHTLDNQYSAADATGTSMFPFIDTGDPASELSQRTIASDDRAWASYHYPDGTAASGPAALQSGDKAFASVYGLITGEATHGVLNQPIAGASVRAQEWVNGGFSGGNGTFVAAGFSGTTQVSVDLATGGLFLVNPAFNILDGRYVIPVPKGSYAVGIEAMDGNPVPAGSVSLTGQIGSLFGQLNFSEEFYNKNKEDAIEVRPGQPKNVHVNPGKTHDGVDIVTTKNININNFGNRNFIGFTGQPAGGYYAVRIPAAQVSAAIAAAGGTAVLHSILYDTGVVDASAPALFAEAMLTTGSVNADGSLAMPNLTDPIQKVSGYLGADDDFAPFFLRNGHQLGRAIADGLADGSIQNLFLVLRVPTATPFPGVSNFPPLIGLDGAGTATGLPNDVPIFGLSYRSVDGGATFTRVNNFNFRFSLVLSEP